MNARVVTGHEATAQGDPRAVAAWLRAQLAPGAQLSADSRQIRPGDAFVAFPGLRSDGRQYIAQAILNGARAVLWQREVFNWPHLDEAAHLAVAQLRERAGEIAHEFYERPSERFELIAITGTNGKTSCSQWIASGYEIDGQRAAVVGTLGSGLIGQLDAFGLTTPDAIALHRMFAQFRDAAVRKVAIEASSIGLDQGRLDGARVVAAVFTNLTHDHLDYHKTMQAYGAAKARLFARPELRLAVVNGDDAGASLMLASLRNPAITSIAYGTNPRRHAVAARSVLLAERIDARSDGVTLTIGGDFGNARIELAVLGRFNALNVCAAMATWLGLGMRFARACELAAQLTPVRGRMQKVSSIASAAAPSAASSGATDVVRVDPSLLEPLVVVDYAHTPDALENALQTLQPVARARGGLLWCVFGAGGDRDPGKRPVMGGKAEALADRVVVTSDNPRGESPFKIISDIRSGLTREPHLSEGDRALAIRRALAEAQPADVVLIAGKGHEEYQEVAGQKLPFSDTEIAHAALLARRGVRHV